MPLVRVPGGQYVRPATPSFAAQRVVLRQFLPNWTFDTFEFPFAPREISFEELSGEVVEIARAGRYAHTEFKAPKLQKVSFDFRIADRDSGGITSVDDKLDKLRQIALRDSLVQFIGLDDLITYKSRTTNARYDVSWYRITNLAIRSVQRCIVPGQGHKIAVADCSMSLVENRNDQLAVVAVPRILYPVDVPQQGTPGGVPGIENPPFNNYA